MRSKDRESFDESAYDEGQVANIYNAVSTAGGRLMFWGLVAIGGLFVSINGLHFNRLFPERCPQAPPLDQR